MFWLSARAAKWNKQDLTDEFESSLGPNLDLKELQTLKWGLNFTHESLWDETNSVTKISHQTQYQNNIAGENME